MIFESEPSQITGLSSGSLAQLMRRLFLAECQLVDIPLRAAAVPLQITVPDGGEDGRVEWSGGVDRTNYLPARFNIFQSKAQNLSESQIRAEVFSKKHRSPGEPPTLNAAVADVHSQMARCQQRPLSLAQVRAIEGNRRNRPSPQSLSGFLSQAVQKPIFHHGGLLKTWVTIDPARLRGCRE
jgi:hypothetical protein